MKAIQVQKSGWNKNAFLAGPFWYLYRGMHLKGLLLLLICIATLGIGVIPVFIYCGCNGNRDFYRFLKKNNIYIYNSTD